LTMKLFLVCNCSTNTCNQWVAHMGAASTASPAVGRPQVRWPQSSAVVAAQLLSQTIAAA
jgi:hypothetical protein